MPTKRRSSAQKALELTLRQCRQEAKLTQAELGERLGRPQSFVSKYESGERLLYFLEIEDICRAIEVPLVNFVRRYEQRR